MPKKYFEKCIGCKERYPACQSHCKYYIDDKVEFEKDKEFIKEQRKADKEKNSYAFDRLTEMKHKEKRRSRK